MKISPILELHTIRWQRRTSLVKGALAAFREREWYEALLLIDPCCQAPIPAAEDLLLRSEILARLGESQLSAADLDEAYAIDPTAPSIQARVLARLWQTDGDGKALIAMAQRLIQSHASSSILRFCLSRVLTSLSSVGAAFPSASRDQIDLLVLTEKPENISVRVRFPEGQRQISFCTNEKHPQADVLGCAASVQMSWQADAQISMLASPETPLLWSRQTLVRPRFDRSLPKGLPRPAGLKRAGAAQRPVVIIVPVFDGLAATKRCLQSLLSDTATRTANKIVIVDDRGPDPRLSGFLDATVEQARSLGRDIELIRNPANIGFICSVNVALAAHPEGAAVLLNADTIVPPGWLDRLVRAGRADKVGTVTPFSNNGELTSVPRMFVATPIPTAADIVVIDRIAADVNAERIVDLPNGIGFCLLLTEAARAACPFINDIDYSEGYLEEVDLCLRIAEYGLRNICACDVFVGHEGGLSFQDRKRALVVRNLGALERRFPHIRRDTHLFRIEDPLAEPRRALEVAILERGAARQRIDLVIGDPARTTWLNAMAASRIGDARPVVRIVATAPGDERSSFRLEGQNLMAPSIYRLPDSAGVEPLEQASRILVGFDVQSISFCDLSETVRPLVKLPDLLGKPYDVRLTQSSFLDQEWSRNLVANALHVTTVSPSLVRLARQLGRDDALLDAPLQRIGLQLESQGQPSRRDIATVAVLLGRSSKTTCDLLLALARATLAARAPLHFVTFGEHPGSPSIETGVVTHAGLPEIEEAEARFRLHNCRATLSLVVTDLYEHPAQPWLRLAPKPIVTVSESIVEPLRLNRNRSVVVLPTIDPTHLLDILQRLVQEMADGMRCS